MASRITRAESNPVNAVVDRMNRKPPTSQLTSHPSVMIHHLRIIEQLE